MIQVPNFRGWCRVAAYLIACTFTLTTSSCASQHPTGAVPGVQDTPDAANHFPAPAGPVSDFEFLLDSSQRARLANAIGSAGRRCDCHIAIVTLDSARIIGSFDEYSTALFNHWGVGDTATDNGLLISLSVSLRKVRITVGTGLESKMTDRAAQEIVNQVLPRFKTGDYAGGLEMAVELVAARLKK